MAGVNTVNGYGSMRIGQWLFATVLVVSFFLPWVAWDGSAVSGYHMASGNFFKISESVGGPADPFPQFAFATYGFWFVPALSLLVMLFLFLKKNTVNWSYLAGALSLLMLTVFVLFTSSLIDLGVGTSLLPMLKPGFYLQGIAAVGLIFTAIPARSWLVKIVWLLAGPVFAFSAYTIGENYIMNETHVATEKVQADFTVSATDLLKEFLNNDTLANKKYLDKTLLVTGVASEVNVSQDSTATIKFADSTGSYAMFSLDKEYVQQVNKIKAGDAVSIKGVCSGSIFSEILETTSITFKRSTLN